MMDFSQGAGQNGPSSLIPNGQLAFAILTVRGVKGSKSGGQYLGVELTIDAGQPYAGKKLWDNIGDPGFSGNSPEYREMGMRSIARILETGRGAGPNNPAGYQLTDYAQLSGLRVAIKIGVEKGSDGYEDKNRIAEYLTPNPQSSANKHYQRLLAGEFNTAKPAAPAATGGFGGQQQPATGGGFGAAGQANAFAAAPASQTGGGFAQSGFPQAAETAGQPATPSTASAFAQTATSPSDAGPGWLQQAQQ